MVIEVINTRHPKALKHAVCDNCAAELSYTKSDCREVTKTDYTGSSDTYRFLDCPVCRTPINVGYA